MKKGTKLDDGCYKDRYYYSLRGALLEPEIRAEMKARKTRRTEQRIWLLAITAPFVAFVAGIIGALVF